MTWGLPVCAVSVVSIWGWETRIRREGLTMVQYAWNPGNGGLEATKVSDSPSTGAVEDINVPGVTIDRGKKIEFCNE